MELSELRAATELVVMLFTEPRSLILLLLLLAATLCDLRTQRIPNVLTFGGTTVALLYGLASPVTMVAVWAGRWAGWRWVWFSCCRCTCCAPWAPVTSS